MTTFAQRLRSARLSRNKRLCQLSRDARLSSPSQLRNYESGVAMPRLPQFARLCIALELNAAEVCTLLGLYGEENR